MRIELWLALALAPSLSWGQARVGPVEGGLPGAAAAGLPEVLSQAGTGTEFAARIPSQSLGLSQEALTSVLASAPEVERELAARVEASPYAAELRESWRPALARSLAPFFQAVAARRGQTLAAYVAELTGSGPEAAADRANLAVMLRDNSSHPYDAATSLLRDHPIWKAPLETYLAERIEAGRAEKKLDLRSVGAGYGVEAYTLAALVERSLRAAGEDPARWDVKIEAYDKSLLSLAATAEGLYKLDPADQALYQEHGLDSAFTAPAASGLRRLRPELARWIRPAYVDLNDERWHPVVTSGKPDVVFANYTLLHLRLAPAAALANHWLSAAWSDHGFLSLAHVVLARVGRGTPGKLTDVGVLRRFEANVGKTGRDYVGDSFNVFGGFLRELWRWVRYPEVRSAKARGEAFSRRLRADPFASLELDPAALAYVEALARTRPVVLTTQPLSAAEKDGKLYVNAGWLAKGPDASARLSVLKALLPSPASAGEGRGGGLAGLTPEGADLKIADGKLYWLSPKLIPLTDDYRSHNAARPAEAELPARGAQRRGRGVRIMM